MLVLPVPESSQFLETSRNKRAAQFAKLDIKHQPAWPKSYLTADAFLVYNTLLCFFGEIPWYLQWDPAGSSGCIMGCHGSHGGIPRHPAGPTLRSLRTGFSRGTDRCRGILWEFPIPWSPVRFLSWEPLSFHFVYTLSSLV